MSNFVNLLDIIYPVGSVYITFSDVSPVDSVGGSWEKIDDKFLQSSGKINANNSIGGFSDTVKLTLRYASCYYNLATLYNVDRDKSLMAFSGDTPSMNNNTTAVSSEYNHDTNTSTNIAMKSIGHPTIVAHKVSWDNRPAYITCNMWKRIA